MSIYDLINTRRTIRKFQQKPIEKEKLVRMIDAARLAPSSANKQSIKYVIVSTPQKVQEIFSYTKWAGYLQGKGTPTIDQQPTAWIILLTDTEIANDHLLNDLGAAAMTIQLAAVEEGLGTCWMGAIDRTKIAEVCEIPDRYSISTIIALGYPSEQPITEEIKDGNIKYYKDEEGILHVPKRTLAEVLLKQL